MVVFRCCPLFLTLSSGASRVSKGPAPGGGASFDTRLLTQPLLSMRRGKRLHGAVATRDPARLLFGVRRTARTAAWSPLYSLPAETPPSTV